jgi:hypothetical protein
MATCVIRKLGRNLQPPPGMFIERQRELLRVIQPMPGRFWLAVLALLAGVVSSPMAFAAAAEVPGSVGALMLALNLLLATMVWTVVVGCCVFAVGSLVMTREVILTPGVLIVRCGWGPLQGTRTVLREMVRRVVLEPHRRGRRSLLLVVEFTPRQERAVVARREGWFGRWRRIAPVVQVTGPERADHSAWLGALLAGWAGVEVQPAPLTRHQQHI